MACYEEPADPSRTDPTYPQKMLAKCAAATGIDEAAVTACVEDEAKALAINAANAKKTAALIPVRFQYKNPDFPLSILIC